MQLFTFFVGQVLIELLEIGLGRGVLEEFDEIGLRVIVQLMHVPFGFISVCHQFYKANTRQQYNGSVKPQRPYLRWLLGCLDRLYQVHPPTHHPPRRYPR